MPRLELTPLLDPIPLLELTTPPLELPVPPLPLPEPTTPTLPPHRGANGRGAAEAMQAKAGAARRSVMPSIQRHVTRAQ
jgi:hypothetical protein